MTEGAPLSNMASTPPSLSYSVRESRESGKIAESGLRGQVRWPACLPHFILCQRILGLQGHPSFLTVNVDKVPKPGCSSPSFATWAQVATPFSQKQPPQALAREGTDV